jgi:hypothetical protein
MRSRHAELVKALAAERFDEVQRQAQVEVQFVQDDQESRLATASISEKGLGFSRGAIRKSRLNYARRSRRVAPTPFQPFRRGSDLWRKG